MCNIVFCLQCNCRFTICHLSMQPLVLPPATHCLRCLTAKGQPTIFDLVVANRDVKLQQHLTSSRHLRMLRKGSSPPPVAEDAQELEMVACPGFKVDGDTTKLGRLKQAFFRYITHTVWVDCPWETHKVQLDIQKQECIVISKTCKKWVRHLSEDHQADQCCDECFAMGSDKKMFGQVLKCNLKMDGALLLRDHMFGQDKDVEATKAKLVSSRLWLVKKKFCGL